MDLSSAWLRSVDMFFSAYGTRLRFGSVHLEKAKEMAVSVVEKCTSPTKVMVALVCMAWSWNVDTPRALQTISLLLDTEKALTEEENVAFLRNPKEMEHALLLAFLFAKDILLEDVDDSSRPMEPEKRVDQFCRVIQKNKLASNASQRLSRLVLAGESGMLYNEPYPSAFYCFERLNREWIAESGSFVAFRDHEKLRGKPKVVKDRRQESGLSFVHAPIVLQHYLIAMQCAEDAKQLDMSQFLRRHESGGMLTERIFFDQGGLAKEFLERILLPGTFLKFLHIPLIFHLCCACTGPHWCLHSRSRISSCMGWTGGL